jgi:hypothetical protein
VSDIYFNGVIINQSSEEDIEEEMIQEEKLTLIEFQPFSLL